MLEYTPILPPFFKQKFDQYADFLDSIGVPEDRYLVAPEGSRGGAEVTVAYSPTSDAFGGASGETTVVTEGGRTLRFASGLRDALFHLAWYLDGERGAAAAQALDTDDPRAAMRRLGLEDDDIAIDGDGRRSGYLIERHGSEARLVLIDTYGEVVPLATSASAATLVYFVRSKKDLETGDLLERVAAFVRRG